jgi:tRNA(Ile)-lysidine synthase
MRDDSWSFRWRQLARAAGLDPREAVVLALSGGADSVFLLHVLAASAERPVVTAVHVDHGLRGDDSLEDARWCARLCARLGVPFERRRLAGLTLEGPGLEARAREARYAALFDVARRLGCRTVLTGHHADDALETVLLRWVRGADLGGLASLRPSLELGPPAPPHDRAAAPGHRLPARQRLRVVRPLLSMRREEVRALLGSAGLHWREDASNSDERFLRNRVRRLVPRLVALGGPSTLDNLRAFGAAVDSLERHLAGATAHIAWQQPAHAVATRSRERAGLGGTLPRAALMRLPSALRRRALWRLILEGTGRAPRRALLDALLDDLGAGRCARHALPCGYRMILRSSQLDCVPPRARLVGGSTPRQLRLRFEAPGGELGAAPAASAALHVPGDLRLPDGRVLTAELVRVDPCSPPPRRRTEVEIDPGRAPLAVHVRFLRPGDRFHPLGAPGSRPLRRFLADSGVPREERGSVPLVLLGEQIAWVAGLRPAEPFRVVRSRSPLRLRLRLIGGAPEPDEPAGAMTSAHAPADAPRQGELWVGAAG